MAKVEFNELVNSVSGKLCKDEKSPIFAQRKDTGTAVVLVVADMEHHCTSAMVGMAHL